MQQGWLVVTAALAYIGLLFAVASYGDRLAARRRTAERRNPTARPTLYALSLGVYCTSWTFFGSVGLAAGSGFDFLTIYIGPAVLFGIGTPVVRRIAALAKAHNITSTADFLAARYGKSQTVAAVVTIIAVIGSIPYIALQLKAVSASLTTLAAGTAQTPVFGDIALLVALSLAAFAILFGTRHVDATEHQEGLMLAIAAESVVKLLAFLAVGLFVVFGLFDGFADLWAKANVAGEADRLLRDVDGGQWITMTLLSFICAIALPRQFHVAVVENNAPREIRRAAWLFPLYLVLINIFVVPIALAGLMTFRDGGVVSDMFVLALPLSADRTAITFAAFIGGLSAATAMVIVETVALAIMISNDLVVPALLSRRPGRTDVGTRLLLIRRAAILALVLLAYGYYRAVGNVDALASIGLLSFAAVAQVGPALFGGLVWRRGTARGAVAGMSAGIAVWAYTMLLPTFVKAGVLPDSLLLHGPFGLAFLKPQTLFYLGFEPLVHSVFWSLSVNIAAYVLVSVLRPPEPVERIQASLFAPGDLAPAAPSLRRWRSAVTVAELEATVARYLGEERAARSFASVATAAGTPFRPEDEADPHLLRHAERLLASAVGAASSRLILSLQLSRGNVSRKAALKLLDDASTAIQYSHDLLQTALDHVRQGIAVFDPDLRLICWNRQFRELLDLPPALGQVGMPLTDVLRFAAERGDFGEGPVERKVAERLEKLLHRTETFHETLLPSGQVLEVRTARLPDGGLVATYTDVTDKVRAADDLALANETLERRVRERTEELVRLNEELQHAKAAAEEANLGKTRFLAAASHDILQPLNAARLYASSLVEGGGVELARNIDSSLEAVEEILGVLLDISRLDAGALKPEVASFRLDGLLRQIAVDFEPLARAKGLDLRIVPSSLTVRSDRRLLRRLLQNFVSNAVKYTGSGRVLVGCRRRKDRVRIEVHDTGPGIPKSKHKLIFREFQRLEEGARAARGLGLGLSIVERIGRVLGHSIDLASTLGRGSAFAVEVPRAASLPRERRPAAPARRTVRLDGLTALCIDNEAQILQGMQTLLAGWGCTVLTAPDRRQALWTVRETGAMPDALLVDYHLDEGNGIEAVAEIRAALGRDIAAVLITADRSEELREAARRAGVAVLNKPLKPAALRALLAQSRALEHFQAKWASVRRFENATN